MTRPDPLAEPTVVDATAVVGGQAGPADQAEQPGGDDRCPECDHEVVDAWLVCAGCGRPLAAPAELPDGARLGHGRYQVLRVLGRGGFGITYDVGDRRLHRRVAMKELFPEAAVRHGSTVLTPPGGRPAFRDARERFMREARVLARFTHPGIVRVYEVFEEHGTAYLVMELLDGRTLVDLLADLGRPFPEAAVLDVAGRVAAALRPVHAAGVLHRDVNPSNIMMTSHGRIVVIDFGLARDYDEEQSVGMTRVVTPGYAPLEQYRGHGRFGPATDVYGLAATCYRLATGRVPRSAMERDGGVALESPRSINPAISKSVSDALLDGLELEASHRPQDLDAFLARLGIARLPDGPRSALLDLVPGSATPVAGREVLGDEVSLDEPSVIEPDSVAPSAIPWRPGMDAAVDGTDVDAGRGDDRTALAGSVLAEPMTVVEGATTVAPPLVRLPAGSAQPPDRARDDGRVFGAPAPPRLPGLVGPHRPGRRKLLLPLTVVALATASAAPVLITVVAVLIVLPLIATLGDSAAHRLRAEYGVSGGWAERRLTPGSLAPARFLRNLLVSTVRAVPMLAIGAVLLGGWYGLDRLVDSPVLVDQSLRIIGLVVVGALVGTARHGSARFRTQLGLDELVARWVPDGRVTERLAILWIVSVFVVAAAIWLTPSPFPLP